MDIFSWKRRFPSIAAKPPNLFTQWIPLKAPDIRYNNGAAIETDTIANYLIFRQNEQIHFRSPIKSTEITWK